MKPFLKYTSAIWVAILIFSIQLVNAQQDNWTHFRGSHLDGISTETQLPLLWNDSTNILWKTDIQDKGWSSPIVYGDQVWLTTATEDGKKLKAVCMDFNTGKKIFDLNLFQPDTVIPKHSINSYATPTPCIEAGFVYLDYGSLGTACVNTSNGAVVWKRTDMVCNHVQGPASSPMIYKNLLILHYEGIDVQYIVALSKQTGETVWKTERPAALYEPLLPIGKKAYITPLIVNLKGKDLLISNGAAVCIAYDPETGKEVWRVVQGEDSTIAMPIAENGIVYFYTSFVSPPDGEKYAELLAVNPDGKGDITGTNILWRFKSPILQLLTPVIKDGLIYTIDTRNVLYCLDAKTGAEMYSKKLKSKYNSSPICDAENVYFTSVKGETMVIKQGKQLQIIAENKLTGEVNATAALLRKSILLRTDSRLYRVGTK
ncbi:MAG TPA: quinonprotein alcohol dehydrogenase [Prolixibacteraceae bacterium]|jgi:outer membrane protein assembly factor BamB|nr:quinonprotein alcohol dehydrogenase [Prolixibacteraceae bacterium]